jgi:hypothetical protein
VSEGTPLSAPPVRRSKQPEVLNPALWRAAVARDGIKHFIDLATMVVVPAGAGADDPVSVEPERYVEVPRISDEEQRSHARKTLFELGVPRVDDLLRPYSWLSAIRADLSPEQFEQFRELRTSWVISQVKIWLRRQGLPFGKFVGIRKEPVRHGPVADLRIALHRAIDRMTDAELLNVSIPARFLL